jgi:hypothetical protein
MEDSYLIYRKKGKQIIIVSILCLLFNGPSIFWLGLAGWGADEGLKGTLYFPTLFFLTISLLIYFISFIPLLWAGIGMVKRLFYSIKLGIIAAKTLIISGLTLNLCYILIAFFNKPIYRESVFLKIVLLIASLFFNAAFWMPIIYAIFLIKFFTRPEVKEQFK